MGASQGKIVGVVLNELTYNICSVYVKAIGFRSFYSINAMHATRAFQEAGTGSHVFHRVSPVAGICQYDRAR